MTVAGGGGIFVSYRRQESSHLAGRLYDRLVGRFGEDQVFIDVDAIEPGVDFAEEIFRAVAACQVLLAIIGPAWLTSADEQGHRRLDDPDDIVRLEIEAALARGVRVIPILMEGTVMPGRHDLPESLSGLARRNALPIRHDSFRSDAGRLVTAIERVLPVPGTAEGSRLHDLWPDGNPAGEAAHKGSKPARDEDARVARLFADAEHTARSIPGSSPKARALASIAGALVAIDPDRAARLFADAERAAQSLTDGPWKALALASIAGALAATDPDRAARLFADAERAAQSLTDGSSNAWALASIAGALAVTDPDRAARLFADAERAAQSIPGGSSNAWALASIAGALAATDPDRAERTAQSITDDSWKAWTLASIAGALAATDPDRAARLSADAERTAQSIPGGSSNAWALASIAGAAAVTDPDRAERTAQSITDGPWKALALASIAGALAATDPDRAERTAQSITDDFWKASVLAGIAGGHWQPPTQTPELLLVIEAQRGR